MSHINLGEVYYKTIRAVGIENARDFLISYADCAVATALEFNTTVVTGDPEFRRVEELVPTEWI